ncbi:MAG: GAF and ANTAR domain-containing protein [Micrococcales bacterium]|nr:GAF and ANTAR domain-containing protein [Micrococcales bacterium]
MSDLDGVCRTMDELEAYLERVVHAVQRHIDGCDEVGVTLMGDRGPQTAACTTAETLQIDGVQYAVGDGPCLDAYRERRENLVTVEAARERWPAFVDGVESFGDIHSLYALPLMSEGEAFGALNLYGNEPDAFTDEGVRVVARAAARRAAEAIHAGIEIIGAREVAAQMEEAMASRAIIEQAKGVLIGIHGIDESRAFDVLRTTSQHRNVKVRDLARQIVESARQGETCDAGELLA